MIKKRKNKIELSQIKERSWVEIDLSNFSHNINELKKHFSANQSFMQIVKADAYGHGALQIAIQAQKDGASILGVANVEEASLLRFNHIDLPILILSPSFDFEIESIVHYKLIPSVNNIEFVEKLDLYAKKMAVKQPIHIKCDTGMNRNGVKIEQAYNLYQQIKKLDNILIEGVFSHFSSSENDKQFTQHQYKLFLDFAAQVQSEVRYIHIANSSAVANSDFAMCNLHRLGLLTYGVYSDQSIKEKVNLKPVMTFKSRLSHISIAKKNESIGYNRTFYAEHDIKYAIIPVGYADGYDFLLSNNAFVEINGAICPILGKVSMDMIAVDISQIDNAQIGDMVTLLGGSSEQTRVEFLSSSFKGSSYELLTQIGKRAKRYYLQNGKINDFAPVLRRDFIPKDFSDDKLNKIIHQALEERITKKELASVIYHDILKFFFIESDRDISYRSNFFYSINFTENDEPYYNVELQLKFDKILQNSYFIVACANNQKALESYFNRKDTEYRWLLDDSIEFQASRFKVSSAKVNDIELDCNTNLINNAIEIKCASELLEPMLNKLAHFEISIKTFYPKDRHQLSVYLSEIYKGVTISFTYPKSIENIDCVPIFSGKHRYPKVEQHDREIIVASSAEDWVFPNSGVVFSY
ncbi:MAG TPA: alanine racemase [Candidatus Cloacimonadota bacterium]|nr:alanine racemase [Candidatus Cloacimonadota bacterium]HOQ80252.1 alanine racemase [Candidatus Cloacimonadota bacterium]